MNVENFEFKNLKSKKPVEGTSKTSQSIKYITVLLAVNGQEAMLNIKGEFRLFTNVKDRKVSHSMRMSIDEENQHFLTDLEKRIREQVVSQLNDVRKDDVILIKASENGYRSISLREEIRWITNEL